MSTFTFTHETKRHWGAPDDSCTLLCEADMVPVRGEPGSLGVNDGWEIGAVEILECEGASPIIGPELRAELHQAAESAAEAMA